MASTTSLTWVGSAVLMGFVLTGIYQDNPTASQEVALLSIAGVGILLSLLVWHWARQLRAVKVAKYARCKEIEKELGMTQHRSLEYKPGSQTRSYSVLMVVFLAAWAILVGIVIQA